MTISRRPIRTPGRVEVGGSATGEIEQWEDRDWFAVELEAGKTYQIDIGGVLTGGGTLPFGRLGGVYNHLGNFKSVSDAMLILPTDTFERGIPGGKIVELFSGEDSQAFFTPDEDGTYYIEVGNDLGRSTSSLHRHLHCTGHRNRGRFPADS